MDKERYIFFRIEILSVPKQMSEENHSNSSASSPSEEKSLWQNITTEFNRALSWYRNVDIKGTVGKYREKINQDVFDNPTLKRLEHLPRKPREMSAELDRDLRALSTTFNDAYPYVASLCRSHSSLMLGSFLVVTVLPIWLRATKFRTVAKSFVGFSLLGQGSLELINYQWRHDLNKPADPAITATPTD